MTSTIECAGRLPTFVLLSLTLVLSGCADDSQATGDERDGGHESLDSSGDADDEEDIRQGGEETDGAEFLERYVDYISSKAHEHMVMEVDYVEGQDPRAAVEDELQSRLDALLDKPDGVDIERDSTIASRGEDHAWSDDELHELADEHFDLDVGEETIKMHAMEDVDAVKGGD